MSITIPISVGELIDKITIIKVKAARITRPDQQLNIAHELALLQAALAAATLPAFDDLTTQLQAINGQLWDIENDIRACEAASDFGPRFVALARSVYVINDRRGALKREINDRAGSELVEEKSYTAY